MKKKVQNVTNVTGVLMNPEQARVANVMIPMIKKLVPLNEPSKNK